MFWDNFVFLCEKKGEAPNAVAAKLKLSSGSVTAWKDGVKPRPTTLLKIANYFGVTVDFLISDKRKEKSPTPNGVELTETQKRALDLIMQLDEKSLKRMIKILEAVSEEIDE